MIVGNPSTFAIESDITQAYERLSYLALGFFTIHIGGHSYGVRVPDASMLACSWDQVEKNILERGKHSANFAVEFDASEIADAFRTAFYGDAQLKTYLGIAASEFRATFIENNLVWAPDGDAAFDDGSFVLQFDVQDRVRLIAFRTGHDGLHDPATIRDVWVTAEQYYRVLQEWRDAFRTQWVSLPKIKET